MVLGKWITAATEKPVHHLGLSVEARPVELAAAEAVPPLAQAVVAHGVHQLS